MPGLAENVCLVSGKKLFIFKLFRIHGILKLFMKTKTGMLDLNCFACNVLKAESMEAWLIVTFLFTLLLHLNRTYKRFGDLL